MNLLDQPGLEALGAWALTDAALSAGAARSGAQGLALTAVALEFPAPAVTGRGRQVRTVVPGATYWAGGYLRRASGVGNVSLSVEDPAGSGEETTLAILASPTLGEWQRVSSLFVPTGSSVALIVRAATGTGSAEFHADDLWLARVPDGLAAELQLVGPAAVLEMVAPAAALTRAAAPAADIAATAPAAALAARAFVATLEVTP